MVGVRIFRAIRVMKHEGGLAVAKGRGREYSARDGLLNVTSIRFHLHLGYSIDCRCVYPCGIYS